MASDAWERRNDIKHCTFHPRAAAAVIDMKVQVQLLHTRKGKEGFLLQDKLLFSKSEARLLKKGELTEILQRISSVLSATRRAAQAMYDVDSTMEVERALVMKRWLKRS